MPKDPTRSIARYKTGGHLNEFEFHKHQEEIAEHLDPASTQLIPGTPPQEQARRLEQVITKVRQKVKKRSKKQLMGKQSSPATRAAKRPAKKKSQKAASRKRQAKGTGARKSTGNKSSANKAARKATKK